jgi:hypothetical protein
MPVQPPHARISFVLGNLLEQPGRRRANTRHVADGLRRHPDNDSLRRRLQE